jgi:endonuclease/exonuclease/phosphatase family metal-dependent hydrolase
MASLSLVSVNVERSKHLDLVRAFLETRQPDVVCMQELMEYDIPYFEQALEAQCIFAPTSMQPAEDKPGAEGIAIFSRSPIHTSARAYYRGAFDRSVQVDHTSVESKYRSSSAVVLSAVITHDGEEFQLATTHFTWTPDGKPDDFQRRDMKSMLEALSGLGEFVLTGDFNAPRIFDGRPGEIFAELASKYKDNIPARYTTSIDGSLHRAGSLELMVDGVFSTPAYIVSDVELHTGVSDHCAVTALITKA